MPEKKPGQMQLYVILSAERKMPPALELPAGYPPLQPVGAYAEFPGGPKGARVWSNVDGPIEDIYTGHYVASADMDYSGAAPTMIFEPEAEQLLHIIATGIQATALGRQLVLDTLKRTAEVVANESTASALGWLADQQRKVSRA